MRQRRVVMTTLLAAGLLAPAALTGPATGQEDPLKVRQAGFKELSRDMRAAETLVKAGGPGDKIAEHAVKMTAFLERVPTLFPPGSDKGSSEAKKEIWSNFDDFVKLAKAATGEGRKLVEVAKANKIADTRKQFAALSDACAACHDKYRNE
jgi:cytochrome c556